MIELLSDRAAADARGRAGRTWALEHRNYERLATEVRDAMRAATAGATARIGQNTARR
jgi:hypothetical protein